MPSHTAGAQRCKRDSAYTFSNKNEWRPREWSNFRTFSPTTNTRESGVSSTRRNRTCTHHVSLSGAGGGRGRECVLCRMCMLRETRQCPQTRELIYNVSTEGDAEIFRDIFSSELIDGQQETVPLIQIAISTTPLGKRGTKRTKIQPSPI